MKRFSRYWAAAAFASLAIPTLLSAQQFAYNNEPANATSASAPASSTTLARPAAQAPAVPAWENKFDRWVDLSSFNYGSRYRSTFDYNGARSFDQGQQKLIADGKFKFDADGRYGIGFHLSSGRYFNWAYADFIGGGQSQFIGNVTAKMSPYELYILNILPYQQGFLNSGGGQLYLRQAFLTAQPIKGFEVQFGGLGINRGVNSEATSYDEDGYMAGERLIIKRPKQIFLSELSYTRGYLGDLYTPNFFARGERLAVSNYWQILGEKDFGKRIAVSADYTHTTPESAPYYLNTTREGILVDTHESKVFDWTRLEAYQRLNGGEYAAGYPFTSGKGYALTVARHFKERFSIEGGVADIDTSYITYLGLNVQALILSLTVNGDQYGVGKRYFVRPTIPVNKYLSLTGNFSHLFDTADETPAGQVDIWNKQALTAGIQIDAKKLLFHSPATH